LARRYLKRQVGDQGRVPEQERGLQVNCCRNLECTNFGIAPLPVVGRGRNSAVRDMYRAIGSPHSKDRPEVRMACKACGQRFTLKSNRAVLEEFERQRASFDKMEDGQCRTEGCPSQGKSVSGHSDLYQSFGKSEAGSLRYRCKACKKTFSLRQSATWRQRKPEINELVLRLLVNKMPMRRICEAAQIEPAVLYNRIDHIYKQSLRFSVASETRLRSELRIERLRIAVDRQDHVFNWASHADRRNTHLMAVGSADCESGYVLALELDYDPDLNPYEADLHARAIGDYDLAPPFRRYARVFMLGDCADRSEHIKSMGVLGANNAKLPGAGMRIHPEYLLMGHFRFLRWMLPQVQSFRFYLDQEPGIRVAMLTAFQDLIIQDRLEAFFVRIAKTMTVDDKKLELARSETYLAKAAERFPGLDRWHVAVEVMRQRFTDAASVHTNTSDRWVESVFSHMGEPRKHVLYATDRGNADPKEVAADMLSASLHPIDRFFMQMRRRIALLERPIATASSAGRMWHGYSCYNPHVAQKLMTSFRTIYNYCLVGQDGKTPAMRFGLAKKPITYDELLGFL